MTQRPGVSLMEVLIAMFVMTIGLLGVLSLFPLGAVRMAQAMKDDRCATINNDIASNMRWVWEDEVNPTSHPNGLYPQPGNPANANFNGDAPGPIVPPPNPNLYIHYDALFNARVNVNYAWNPDLNVPAGTTGSIPAAYRSTTPALIPSVTGIRTGPSYPVFVDPIGWNSNNVNVTNPGQKYWIGGNTSCIPRRSLRRIEWAYVANQGYIAQYTNATTPSSLLLRERYFVHQDDIGFGLDGTPVNGLGNATAGSNNSDFGATVGLQNMAQQVQRDGRYNCALMIQWEDRSNVQYQNADVTIVVYSGRSLDLPSAETVYSTLFTKGSTEAQIVFGGGTPPSIRNGTWILDGTMTRPNNNQLVPEPHGNFYRIISVTSVDTVNGIMYVELQTPALASTFLPSGQLYGLGVVMDNVVEVFPGRKVYASSRPVP